MTALYIILVVLGTVLVLYLVFIIGPTILSFDKIFGKKSAEPLKGRDISKSYFAPFEQMMRDAAARVEKNYELQRVRTTSYDGLDLYADYIDL